MSSRTYYRLALAVALVTVLFLAFGIGALGIIGPGGRPDLMYVGAVAVVVVGAFLARFRSPGMALALPATAAATVLAGVVARAPEGRRRRRWPRSSASAACTPPCSACRPGCSGGLRTRTPLSLPTVASEPSSAPRSPMSRCPR